MTGVYKVVAGLLSVVVASLASNTAMELSGCRLLNPRLGEVPLVGTPSELGNTSAA